MTESTVADEPAASAYAARTRTSEKPWPSMDGDQETLADGNHSPPWIPTAPPTRSIDAAAAMCRGRWAIWVSQRLVERILKCDSLYAYAGGAPVLSNTALCSASRSRPSVV